MDQAIGLGESALTTRLALELAIDVECPEPTDGERFRFLSNRGYSAEQIAAYYLARAASMAELWRGKMDLAALIQYRVAQLAKSWPWDQETLSYASVDKYLRGAFGRTLLETSPQELASLVSPAKDACDSEHCVLNAIGATVVNYTDIKIVLRLLEAAQQHERILVVFGASHALRQERALREMLRGRLGIGVTPSHRSME